MADPAPARGWTDAQQRMVTHRRASWARVRTVALQGRPAAGWDALLGDQIIGGVGWLAKLKQRLLGTPKQNLRGSFRAAQAKARGVYDAGLQDSRERTELIAMKPDLLTCATDHLLAGPEPLTETTGNNLGDATEPVSVKAPDPTGWRGSTTGQVIEGIFETPEDVRARRALRRAPEVQAQVKRLWDVAHKWQGRMAGSTYFDFHLSIFHYIIEKEEGTLPEVVDGFDAWEAALDDFVCDTEASFKLYGNRALHFDAFADAGMLCSMDPESAARPALFCDALRCGLVAPREDIYYSDRQDASPSDSIYAPHL